MEVTRAAGLPEFALPDAAARAFTRGGFVPCPAPDAPRAAVLAERDALFLGLGRVERGVLWPVSVFASATEALR